MKRSRTVTRAAGATVLLALAIALAGCADAPPAPRTLPQATSTESSLPVGSTRPTSEPSDPSETSAPGGTFSMPPPATNASAAPSRNRLRQRADQELAAGLIAYNPPSSSTIGREFQVTARIQRGETAQPSLTELPGNEPVVQAKLPVGTFLRADLDGANFDVELIGEELQSLVTDDGFAEWAWKVEPQLAGHQTLRLTVYVELDGEPLSNQVFDREIDVQVQEESMTGRITGWSGWTGWTEIMTGLVVAGATAGIGALVAHRRRSATRRAATPAQPSPATQPDPQPAAQVAQTPAAPPEPAGPPAGDSGNSSP